MNVRPSENVDLVFNLRPLAAGAMLPPSRSAQCVAKSSMLMPVMASPMSSETSASIFVSLKCVTALTIARARFSGSEDLKMPLPTKTPSTPSCMQSAASAGVATPPA
eukprot:CAMPEP_0117496008 /NCGR_PEP_ID=MMETSP0784-20121206/20432_1 /TAXON_ID=39447 /ORGANISM="" /LENGTH=106 /DNA_ID=CAMNT_0005290959 /DNA_START=73 /DNA_END=390 /DNA_ORIENTATION=+